MGKEKKDIERRKGKEGDEEPLSVANGNSPFFCVWNEALYCSSMSFGIAAACPSRDVRSRGPLHHATFGVWGEELASSVKYNEICVVSMRMFPYKL